MRESKEKAIEILVKGLLFPEGPAFAPDGSLWFVELKGASLVQLKDGVLQRFKVGGKPNGLAINDDELIWFCDSEYNAIRSFNPKTELTKTVVAHINGEILNEPNDLAFDKNGNLVFTCPGNSRQEASGYVCVLKKNGEVKKIAEDKYFPNGLAFTNDGKELIIAETYKHQLWKGDWDAENCHWNNPSVFAVTGGPIGPDGLAFNCSDDLYVAVYGSAKIKVINLKGEIIDQILMPGNNPTNCAFDPRGKLGLVVTEAEKGILLSVQV